jgi:hypothetical protein
MLYIGRRADLENKRHLIEINSIVYGLSWIFRFLARAIPSVLLFDFLTKVLKGSVAVPTTALTYEKAGSGGADQAIAYSVFYEFSLSIGKIVTALVGIWVLAATGNIYLVFAFAGILTMFYGLLK